MTLAERVIRDVLDNGKTVEIPSLELSMTKSEDDLQFGRAVNYGRTNSICDHCGRTATLAGICEDSNTSYPSIWLCKTCLSRFSPEELFNSSSESDKKAVRAYLTRLYRNAEAKDDNYALGQLNMINKVLNKMWGG